MRGQGDGYRSRVANIEVVAPAHLTLAILDLTAELDAGKTCALDEVKNAVADRSFFGWLRSKGVETLQFDTTEQEALFEVFDRVVSEVNERRKFAVEHNGFALAAAYFVEALQQRLAAAELL